MRSLVQTCRRRSPCAKVEDSLTTFAGLGYAVEPGEFPSGGAANPAGRPKVVVPRVRRPRSGSDPGNTHCTRRRYGGSGFAVGFAGSTPRYPVVVASCSQDGPATRLPSTPDSATDVMLIPSTKWATQIGTS